MKPGEEQPLVSVLTPSMNQGYWLGENLASVSAQSYSPIEHVVMDGGSTDQSLEILATTSRGVVWRSEPDGGQTEALAKAFDLSTGSIVGWLNSDDAYYSRRSVEHAVKVFSAFPHVDVLFGHSAVVDTDGRILHFNWVPGYHARVVRVHNYIVQPAVFMRRTALERWGFVDPSFQYAMDRELWLRLALTCRFARLDHVVAIDRHHDQRKSYTRLDLYRPDERRLRDDHGVSSPRVRLKVLKVAFRLAGLRLAMQPNESVEYACKLSAPPRTRRMLQQALLPRRRI